MKHYVAHILKDGKLYDEELAFFDNTPEGKKYYKKRIEEFEESLTEELFYKYDEFEEAEEHLMWTDYTLVVFEETEDYDGYKENEEPLYEMSLEIDTDNLYEMFRDAKEYREEGPYHYYGVYGDFF